MPGDYDDPPRTRPTVVGMPKAEEDAVPAPAGARDLAMEPDDDFVSYETFRAILSSHQRAGRWEAADEIEAVAILGEVTLDFTRADLPPGGVVDIEAQAILGEVKIIVPAGAEVEVSGTPFLGSIEQHVRRKGTGEVIREWVTGERDDDLPAAAPDDQPPLFRIDGSAILGSIRVSVR
jgi:hypothetical protein